MQDCKESKPLISVIVICYDMRREAPRTMMSLAPEYQKFNQPYEIDLVEMPSERMLTQSQVEEFPSNTRYFAESENLPLPQAVNRAVARARADHVLICVDGARILSHGILRVCNQAMKINRRGVLAVNGLHLGTRPQQIAVAEGSHSKEIEDALLADIQFPKRPNRLWKIACWAGSSKGGVFDSMAESCAIFLQRDYFHKLGGFDERLVTPGGGLSNCDFFTRATSDPTRPLFVPIGEGTFHQCHGGSTTGRPAGAFEELKIEFKIQTGREFQLCTPRNPQYLGAVPPQARPLLQQSLETLLTLSRGDRPAGSAVSVNRAFANARRPPAQSLPPRDVTLVIGMHRSGTSFLTRQLLSNGYEMPGESLGGSIRSNPEGHHEPKEVVGFGNRVLAEQNLTWYSLSSLQWGDAEDGTLIRNGRALGHLLLDIETESCAPWVIKDPRVCLMLPIWQQALNLLGWRATQLFILRDPMLVALSLAKRDGIAIGHGLLLWARYVASFLESVEDPDDVLCIDKVDSAGLAKWLVCKTGQESFDIQTVQAAAWRETSDPICTAYRRFTEDRDISALKMSLKDKLSFVELYKDYFRSADLNMSNGF